MYKFESRIRYSETDNKGKLALCSLLDYFQDCSTFQSEHLGLGLQYMKERDMVWVLSAWQIVVERYPVLCEEVEIGTLPYEFRGFLGSRNFCMMTKQGEYLAKANTLWSLLSTKNMKPVAANAEMIEGFKLEPKLEMEYAPRKIAIPKEEGTIAEPIIVKRHHLDTNQHVNNGRYIDMAMEFLPSDYSIHQMRAEYKKQAWLDDILYPYIVQQDNKYIISLQDNEGVPFVNVEFI